MKGSRMKKLPNIITFIRIVLSMLLPFSRNNIIAFFILYTVCGFSDVLDGILARRLKATSRFGAFLDSIADVMFLIMSLGVVFLEKFYWSPNLIAIIVIIMILRITNLAYTRYKFKQWGMIHTIGNKLTGLLIFVIIPIAIIFGELKIFFILLVGLMGILSAIDESIILMKSRDYDVNKRSFLCRYVK
jgi:CDP-diacylglycerol--glycerol-3-phosphate 3-phosphatidyltransferase